ncbi:unnamed protein product [Rotaria sp. Silwood2]|nr:unnamed protein product [Rotaria sp. Silwood2]
MKTNTEIKSEPNEIQNYSTKKINKLLDLHDHNQIKKLKTNSTNDSMTNLLVNQEQESSMCIWCHKFGSISFTLQNDDGDSKKLCSEVCFNQYRRASFKKNKDKKLLKIRSTFKIKSTNHAISQKISKPTISENKRNHQQKIFSSKIKKINTNEVSRKLSPLPSLKRHQSSSSSHEKTSINIPINFTCSSSHFPLSALIDRNHFQYSLGTVPSIQQLSSSLPFRTSSSTLFSMLTKELLPNYTCILPSFIPLPIPIPLCFPVHLPCGRYSTDVINQECQTKIRNNIDSFPIHQQETRRISI